ncbi:MAG: hypothetical protein KIG32_06565 [Ruminiclostridium sp.]|nr:hypothetical protein [Ruminiclostridium sp.]
MNFGSNITCVSDDRFLEEFAAQNPSIEETQMICGVPLSDLDGADPEPSPEPVEIDFSTLKKEDFSRSELFENYLRFRDEISAAEYAARLIERAAELKAKTVATERLKPYKKELAARLKKERADALCKERAEKISKKLSEAGFGDADYIYPKRDGTLAVNTALLARYIQKNVKYRIIGDGVQENRLFLYQNGIYSQCGDDALNGFIRKFVESVDPSILKTSDLQECRKLLYAVSDPETDDIFDSDADLIVFNNGVLNVRTKEFGRHDPDVLSTVKLNMDYDPTAHGCSVTRKFLNDLCGGSAEWTNFLCELVGAVLSAAPLEKAKKIIFITGAPHSGKSQLISLLQRLLGSAHYCVCTPKDIETNKYASSDLYHKRLCGCSDLGFCDTNEVQLLKQISGGDNIRAEVKYGATFSFVYHGILLYACNELPKFAGADQAFYDRLIVLKVEKSVPENLRDPDLINKLIAEAPAAFNELFLPGLTRFLDNGMRFTVPESNADNVGAYVAENSTAVGFYIECCRLRETLEISKNDPSLCSNVLKLYREWCNVKGTKPLSAQRFNQQLMEYLKQPSLNNMKFHRQFGDFYIFELNKTALTEYRPF